MTGLTQYGQKVLLGAVFRPAQCLGGYDPESKSTRAVLTRDELDRQEEFFRQRVAPFLDHEEYELKENPNRSLGNGGYTLRFSGEGMYICFSVMPAKGGRFQVSIDHNLPVQRWQGSWRDPGRSSYRAPPYKSWLLEGRVNHTFDGPTMGKLDKVVLQGLKKPKGEG